MSCNNIAGVSLDSLFYFIIARLAFEGEIRVLSGNSLSFPFRLCLTHVCVNEFSQGFIRGKKPAWDIQSISLTE